MAQAILITGATGMVGKALSCNLLAKGYIVHQLTRKDLAGNDPRIKKFRWDVYGGSIDPHCVENVSAVIHLAGENIAAKPWTKKRRAELVESRTKSISMIYDLLRQDPDHQIKTVVSASAIGFYGDRGDTLLTETSGSGTGFLADVTAQWEKAVDTGNLLNLRVVKLRSAVILDKKEGALPELSKSVKAGLPVVLGRGSQWMPWIHLEDAVDMYAFALEHNNMTGAYNMTAPECVTHEQFMQTLARAYHKKCWLPHVPALVLRMVLGKMSESLLMSTKASPDKILNAGFSFKFPELANAMNHIIHND